ncbi:EAL domain-containing protein [Candidatus Colwellia aromaticivorans]|uniref:EAL domain-containing protein n=1 Tax=Candidatus Colwellia aromaticivorans TaxID=2267621 RepID=UPI000DF122FF|nr:GGDEF domain-containing protein [Candidatus Colwellia aromaticivorans]
MYTFPQLLLRNAILSLIFIICISALSLSMLSSLLEDKATQHSKVISVLTKQSITTDGAVTANDNIGTAKGIAKALQQATNYNVLIITNKAGENLFNYKNSDTGLTLPLTAPKSKNHEAEQLGLNVEYQLDFSGEYILVVSFILFSIVLSSSLVVFAATMSNKRHKAVFKIISQQIKNDLALINHPNKSDTEKSGFDCDILEIPELKQGISDIKELMTKQIENTIALEKEAYVDHLTKIDNRNRFVQFYENQVVQESPVQFGVLIIIRCSELQTINQIHGYKEGDNYISHVANLIKKALSEYSDANIFRLNSSDFACILPNIELKEAEKFTSELTLLFNKYQQESDLDSVAYSGLVRFDKSKPLGELLAFADTGVSVAQTQSSNSWYSQKDTDILQKNTVNYGNQNWRQEIDSVLENQRITLLLQPIQPNGRNNKVYGEILARFLNSNDEMLPTASFIAMAEKLDKITAVDRLIIETAINQIINKNMFMHSFGINISARSISDEHFIIWLERKLLREPKVAPLLIFEITEYGLQQNIKTSKRLIDMLHRVGSRITVERFGVGLTSFKFFRDLTPDYIKMDSSYTRDIDDDKNNQYFLRLMVDLAHRLSINVLAESVESQEEKHMLEKLFIDGCQGFYIGKPAPL